MRFEGWDSFADTGQKTVLFADVVDSTRLIETDERASVAAIDAFVSRVATETVAGHRGVAFETRGDGVLAVFDDPCDAVNCARALHARAADRAGPLPEPLRLRIGMHRAALLEKGERYYGHGLNVAARLTAMAGPAETVMSRAMLDDVRLLAAGARAGGTLVTAGVRDTLAHGLDGDFEDAGEIPLSAGGAGGDPLVARSLGDLRMKNLREPVRAYRVGPVGPQPVVPPSSGSLHELRPAIAVLPFESDDVAPGRLGTGDVVADQLIGLLSLSSAVRVISRLSTQAMRSRGAPADAVQRVLGASYAVSGRVYRQTAHSVLVAAELAAVATHDVLWTGRLQVTDEELLRPDAGWLVEAANAVLMAIVRAEVREARGLALPNLKDHTLYLTATTLLHRFSRADFDLASSMLAHLHERAPKHPLPLAWQARWHVFRIVQGWSQDLDLDRRHAREFAQRALDLDCDSSLALTIAGSVRMNVSKDLAGATELYRDALEKNPSESLAWILLGTAQAFGGQGESALGSCRRALGLAPIDPVRFFYDNLAAAAALTAGDYALALRFAEQSVRTNRMHTSSLRTLAISQVMLGKVDDARVTAQQLLAVEPGLTAAEYIDQRPFGDPDLGRRLASALVAAGVPAGDFQPAGQ